MSSPSDQDLSLLQVAMRVAMACGLTAAVALGAFFVIRLVAGAG
jgi:hypothetical protein